ncbi:hypothetical protein VNO80_08017 [Phaseolus coccineus]|uniref:Uncharacterized protein n=1 Tax=Phaseolus coccineus TaxID=3886 RepID=A0AAN9RFV2_PHACN
MDGPGLGVVKGGYDVWYTRLPRVETSILFDHCGGNSDGWTGQTIIGFSLEDFDAGWTFSSDVNLDWGAGKKGSRMQGAGGESNRKVEEHIRLNKSRGSVTGEAARAEAVGFTAEEAARAEEVGLIAGEAA